MHAFETFTDLRGNPMVRIYQQQLTEPVSATVGSEVTVTVEGCTFSGRVTEATAKHFVLRLAVRPLTPLR